MSNTLSPSSFNNRRFKNLINRPSAAKPLVERVPFYSGYFSPVSKVSRNPLISYHSIISPVSGLVFSRSPLAIIGRIWSIIIYPIKGMAFVGYAHVFKKVTKRISPSFAHKNSSLSIVLKGWAFWVVASLFNSKPYIICRRITQTVSGVRFVKFSSPCAGKFAMKASTGFCFVADEVIAPNSLFCPARAKAIKVFFINIISTNYSKSVKFFSSQISHAISFLIKGKAYNQKKDLSIAF